MPPCADRWFDSHIAVDWSANATPVTGPNSIWIAGRSVDGSAEVSNPPTRHAALHWLERFIDGRPDERILIGVDAAFGYPAGTADALGVLSVDTPPWRTTWDLITSLVRDSVDNRNHRFQIGAELNRRIGMGEGPFWGHPRSINVDGLRPTKPDRSDLPEYRIVERRLRARGFSPKSVWQLAYAGSVGGQTLMLIPVLAELLRRRRVEVWPFTTGFVALPGAGTHGAVVLAELWPSGFAVDMGRHRVRDAAQVLGVVDALAAADAAGDIGSWFVPRMTDDERRIAGSEEAWILGPT